MVGNYFPTTLGVRGRGRGDGLILTTTRLGQYLPSIWSLPQLFKMKKMARRGRMKMCCRVTSGSRTECGKIITIYSLVGVIIVLGVACAYLLLDSFSTIVCDKISIMYFIQTFYQNVSTLLYNTYIT